MNKSDIRVLGNYDSDTHFITPDRKLEQFLYKQGFPFLEFVKGETGWTYWVYQRSPELLDAVNQFVNHRTRKKEVLRQLSAELGELEAM